MFKLSQTLAGTWVITTPNPEERGWETQLAEFDMTAVTVGTPSGDALEMAAATSLAVIVSTIAASRFNEGNPADLNDLYKVTSHDTNAVARMEERVNKAFASMRDHV